MRASEIEPGMRKVSTTVYMTHEQVEALRRLAEKTHIPQAVIIRKGIDLAIDWYEEREEMLELGLKTAEKNE